MKHYLNGVEVTPRNLEDIGISVDYSKDVQQESVNIDSVVLPVNGRSIVMQHLNTIGLSEGIPYEITFANKKLPYYVDLVETLKIRDTEVEVKLKQRYAHDNFIENADSLTFDYLNTITPIGTYDVKYRIIQQDAFFKSVITTATLYTISRSIADQTRELAKTAKEFGSAIAFAPFAVQGKIVEAGIQLALQIAYLAILIYQAKKLGQDLVEYMFPKARIFKASKVLELMQKGCSHLGYTFKSSILEKEFKNLATISTPQNREKKGFLDYLESDLNFAFNTGFPTITDSTPTLGALIKAMQTMFNAKVKIRNKVVELERWDYWIDQAQGQVKVALPVQDSANDEYELDTERMFKRYLIEYQTDFSDMTTLDDYSNTISEYSSERVSIVNQDLNLLKGLTNATIPFARAKRKTFVNAVEKTYLKLLKGIDKLSGGNSANVKSPIGIMEVSSQFFSVTKLVLIDDGGKLFSNEMLFPSNLWDKFHYINNPNLYAWAIRRKVPLALTEEEFLKLLDNNYAQINGKQCEILNLEYLPMQNRAIIDYKQKVSFYKTNVAIKKIY
jgi:hypothetical protein